MHTIIFESGEYQNIVLLKKIADKIGIKYKEKNQKKKNQKIFTFEDFSNKWLGILEDVDFKNDYKDDRVKMLIEKHK